MIQAHLVTVNHISGKRELYDRKKDREDIGRTKHFFHNTLCIHLVINLKRFNLGIVTQNTTISSKNTPHPGYF